MDRKEARELVDMFVKNQALVNHMLSVEAAMRFYARMFQQDEDFWGITGLLHDFDWEIHPTPEEHPIAGETILRQYLVDDVIIRAILSHGSHPGYPRESLLEHGLYACDEVTGLITAVALVRPSRSLYDLSSSSVKKKWKDRAFAAGANREEIQKGADEINIELWQHVDHVIIAMRQIAPEIGLAGNLQPS